MHKNSITQYELFNDYNIINDICDPMTQQFCGIMKDQIISLPPETGTGYFRYISPCKYMEMYISDVTFHKKTVLSEYTCRDSYSISFCISDELQWENSKTGIYSVLEKGDCCVYGNSKYHVNNYYDPGKRYVGIGLELHPCRFQAITDCLVQKKVVSDFESSLPAIQKFKITRTVESILHQILRCNYIDSLKPLYLEGKILELASAFANEVILEKDITNIRKELSISDSAALAQIQKIIDKNYADPLTISELAKQSFMSESKLRTTFKQQYGLTIYQYILRKRMEKARDLFEKQRCKVKDVASLVGYSNISHFSENFRKKFGLTPTEYLKSFHE